MDDCKLALSIKEKISDRWDNLGSFPEYNAVNNIELWQDAEAYLLLKRGMVLEILQNEVISLAGLTNDEISCLYNNLSREGFAKTGLKAPKKEQLLVVVNGTVCLLDVDNRESIPKKYVQIKGFGSKASAHIIDNAKTLIYLDLQELSNAKIKAYHEWMEEELKENDGYMIKDRIALYEKLINQSFKELI